MANKLIKEGEDVLVKHIPFAETKGNKAIKIVMGITEEGIDFGVKNKDHEYMSFSLSNPELLEIFLKKCEFKEIQTKIFKLLVKVTKEEVE